jgi:cell division protein FtsZ
MGDEVKITVIATGFKQDMPERRARMLAESTLPGADYQVPIRAGGGGWNASARPSETAPMFASEERERLGQAIAVAPAKVELAAAIAEPTARECELREDGSLHGNRIWVSPREMDDAEDWGGEEAEEAGEFVAEAAAPETIERRIERDAELLPVAASVFDDEFFRTKYVGGRPVAEPENEVPVATAIESEVVATGVGRVESWDPGGERETWSGREAAPAGEARLFAGATGSHAAEADELDIPAFLRRSR